MTINTETKMTIDMGSSKNKGMTILHAPNSALMMVKWTSGGTLPAALDGHRWTTREMAIQAVDMWQESNKAKSVKGK